MAITKLLGVIWASPWSIVGLTIGCVALATGARAQLRLGVCEFYGGGVRWLLESLPMPAMAMTLGHVVLGLNPTALDIARDHELVHVRQYERWGPFFVPVYFLLSLWVWWLGGRAYRDNPFEREAYGDHLH